MQFITKFIIPAILLLGITVPVLAQDQVDPDDLFREARTAAFENEDYETAIRLSLQALEIAPDYIDIKEFLGRVYFWNGQSDEARMLLKEVLDASPGRILPRSTLADIYIESGDYQDAIALLDDGLKQAPANIDFLFKKGYALELSGRNGNAIYYYRNVQDLDPTHPFVNDRIEGLGTNSRNWQASLQSSYSWFEDTDMDPWILTRVGLTRKGRLGSFELGFNYAERFALADQEIEFVGYPVITSSIYAFTTFGVAVQENFFPAFRGGVALYKVLPGQMEASLGFRYLSFDTQNVSMLTGSFLKLTSRYRFNFQAFLTIDESSTNISGVLSGRRYFSNTDNFLELRTGYGAAAGEYNSPADVNRENSFEVAGMWQKSLSDSFIFFTELGFYNEQFSNGIDRSRYEALAGIQYDF